MSFVIKKKISLDWLGEGWEEAYIVFSPFSYGDNVDLIKFRKIATKMTSVGESDEEIEKVSNKLLKLLTDKLVEGQGYNGKGLEPITKDNFKDLPVEVFNHCLNALQGEELSPKSLTPSGKVLTPDSTPPQD